MHGHQFGAVWKGGFHLNVRDHVGDAVHHICACEQCSAFTHELGHGFAIPRALHDGGTDKGHSFGVIEFETAGFSAFGQEAGGEYQQFVFFTGCEFYGALFSKSDSSLPQATCMPSSWWRIFGPHLKGAQLLWC